LVKIAEVDMFLGKIYDVSTPVPYEPSLLWTLTCPLWIPKRLVALGLDQLYFEKVGYGIDKAFKQINCNSKVLTIFSVFQLKKMISSTF